MPNPIILADPAATLARCEQPVPRLDYRNAMSRLGAAVNIITTAGPAGRAGFTASAVCSVTDEPPTLLVCLNRSSSVYDAFNGNAVLCVNVLASGHQALAARFGGKTPMDERFAMARWRILSTGSPVLDGAIASFDCRIMSRSNVGSHDVLYCQVAAVADVHRPRGLVYFDRAYHELATTPPTPA